MISVCWTCGGVGDYLEGDERRAMECFGCQVSREVDEHQRMTTEELVAEFNHTWPRHHGSVCAAAPILGYDKPSSLARRLTRARDRGLDVKFIDDSKSVSA